MHHTGFGLLFKNILNAGAGSVTVSGTAQAGKTLTATYNMDDPEGGETGITYQWYQDASPIGGATSSTYNVVTADVGSTIKCRVSYTDGNGNSESPFSSPTSTVIAAVLSISLAGAFDLASSNTTTPSQNGIGIGTAQSDRYVFVVWIGPTSTALQADLKMNGVSANFIAGMSIASVKMSLWALNIPTGTTVDVQGQYSGSPNNINTFEVYTIIGSGNLALSILDTANISGTSGPASKTFATINGGVTIGAIGYSAASAQTITTGLTQDHVRTVSSNKAWFGSLQNTNNSGISLAIASFTGNRGLIGASITPA